MAKKATAVALQVEYLPPDTKRERKGVVVDRELEKLYDQHQVVTVDLVLSAAASPKHPLHTYFEWDDAAAAQKYRRVQAYSLIMGSKFVVQLVASGQVEPKAITEAGHVRRLVSAFRGEGFKMRAEALADTEQRKAIIETKKSVLRSWCNSTIDIAELQPLRELILSHL
jgi:hypothetical protein